jgi:hypothetical protein
MRNGACRALFFAACAENYTSVGVFHDGLLFSVVLYEFVGAKSAVFYAFSTADAFIIVYFWMPRYLASRNPLYVSSDILLTVFFIDDRTHVALRT